MRLAENIDSAWWFKAIRWVLVAPAAILGFYAAMYISMLSFERFNRWCPGGEIVSGLCNVPWVRLAPLIVGAIIVPSLIILFGTLMAPSKRPVVAWAIYGIGILISLTTFRLQDRTSILITVALAGAGMALAMQLKFRQNGGA